MNSNLTIHTITRKKENKYFSNLENIYRIRLLNKSLSSPDSQVIYATYIFCCENEKVSIKLFKKLRRHPHIREISIQENK